MGILNSHEICGSVWKLRVTPRSNSIHRRNCGIVLVYSGAALWSDDRMCPHAVGSQNPSRYCRPVFVFFMHLRNSRSPWVTHKLHEHRLFELGCLTHAREHTRGRAPTSSVWYFRITVLVRHPEIRASQGQEPVCFSAQIDMNKYPKYDGQNYSGRLGVGRCASFWPSLTLVHRTNKRDRNRVVSRWGPRVGRFERDWSFPALEFLIRDLSASSGRKAAIVNRSIRDSAYWQKRKRCQCLWKPCINK